MDQNLVTILGIETSCDETAAAVATVSLKDLKTEKRQNSLYVLTSLRPHLLSNIVASQVDIHAATGGVVPEVAARAHVEAIIPTIEQAIKPLIYGVVDTENDGLASKVRKVSVVSEETNSLTSEGVQPERSNQARRYCRDDLICIFNAIDAIAVTTGPGLTGSLLIGIETAKTLGYVFGKPIVPVNHLEGHIYANFVGEKLGAASRSVPNFLTSEGVQPERPNQAEPSERDLTAVRFPALVLIVSGGHTELILMQDHLQYERIGQTRDDAAGECFDKCARLLGLPYPGGPALSKLAQPGDPKIFNFPRPMIKSGDFDFSFSGLKTAVYYTVRKVSQVRKVREHTSSPAAPPAAGRPNQSRRYRQDDLTAAQRADLAASIQAAIVDVLVAKTIRAAKKFQVKTVMISGGVAANRLLRQTMGQRVRKELLRVNYRQPNLDLATDNAGMIATAGIYRYLGGYAKNWYDVGVDANAILTQNS